MSSEESRPYPWPVRPILLMMMGLPKNASRELYEAEWGRQIAPLAAMSDADHLQHLVYEIMEREAKGFDMATQTARTRFRHLFDAAKEEKKKGDMANAQVIAERRKIFNSALADFANEQGLDLKTKYERAYQRFTATSRGQELIRMMNG